MVCPKCRGTKKIAPLGAIQKDCDQCNGLGQIMDVPVVTPVKRAKRQEKEIKEIIDEIQPAEELLNG